MKKFFERIINFIIPVFEENAIDYAGSVIESFDETVSIMQRCPWVFSWIEMVKLFLTRYAAKVIIITVMGLLWIHWGIKLATELFYACSFPYWMMSICLLIAANKFGSVLKELFFL